MRLTAKRLLLCIAVIAAAAVAAVWAVGSALSSPAPRSIGKPPSDLAAQAVSFPSQSGSDIRAWLVRGRPGSGGIVLAHSVRSSRLEMIGRARFLHLAGYSVLLFDAQAHGESPGEHITFGYLEARDARAAVDFLAGQLPEERLGYLGVSQGGAAALLAPSPLEVEAFILEAVYPTLQEAVHNRVEIRLGPLAGILAPLLLAQVAPRLGIAPNSIAPIDSVRQVGAPLLLIAGEMDRRTTLSESMRLYGAAPAPKELWVVPGAVHQDLHGFARVEYEKTVLDFFSRALRSEVGPRTGRER